MRNLMGKGAIIAASLLLMMAFAFAVHAENSAQNYLQVEGIIGANSAPVIPSNANVNAEVNAAVSGNGTSGGNTSLSDISSAISNDTPRGLGLFFTRIRYFFASNPDAKAQLGLKIAQSHLLTAEENFRNGNTAGAQAQVQKYSSLQERIASKYNSSQGADSQDSVKNKFMVDKQLQINAMFTSAFQQRINDSSLSADQKEKILSAVSDAKNKTDEANNAVINARHQVIAALNASGKNVSEDDLETEAEDSVVSRYYGENRSSAVIIISSARFIQRVNLLYGNFSNLNSTGNASAQASARLDEAKARLQSARNEYNAGNFSAAKQDALEAHKLAVSAMRIMLTSSVDARLLARARLDDNHPLLQQIEQKVMQRMQERENESGNFSEHMGTVNETLKERLQNQLEQQKQRSDHEMNGSMQYNSSEQQQNETGESSGSEINTTASEGSGDNGSVEGSTNTENGTMNASVNVSAAENVTV